jgi:hypothetical protein
MKKQILKETTLIIFSFSVLFASFGFNFFGAATPDAFQYLLFGDEQIIKDTVICEVLNGKPKFGGVLVYTPDLAYWGSCNPTKVQPYISQLGLQAKIIGLFAPRNVIQLDSYFRLLNLIFSALTAAIFCLFLWAVLRSCLRRVDCQPKDRRI